MIPRQGTLLAIGLLALTASTLVGCADRAANQRSTPAASAPLPPAASPTVSPSIVAPRALLDEHVRVLGLWSGPEYDSFVAVKAVWEAETGGIVDWEGTQDLPNALAARLEAGIPPDIAILPNPGLMQELARDEKLTPLDSFLDMRQVTQDYAPAWIDLGSYNGSLYAIFYKVSNKATVWYNPRAFAAGGYRIPTTWDEMIALAEAMVAHGHTPFSVAAPSGPASGWALTDWISQIVLSNCGPELYDSWVAGETPWTDACIRESFELLDAILHTPGYVLGGNQGILTTTDSSGAYPIYTDPPKAYMYYLASFAQAFIEARYPQLAPGDDFDFFTFPSIQPQYAGAVISGADVVVMLNDTPAARSFIAYLAGAQAQETWIRLGGFMSVNLSVSPDAYADPIARAAAKALSEAKIARFSAGDRMPAAVQKAWWKAMLELVEEPSQLDAILSSLTQLAQTAK